MAKVEMIITIVTDLSQEDHGKYINEQHAIPAFRNKTILPEKNV
jgi:hypothetical protein